MKRISKLYRAGGNRGALIVVIPREVCDLLRLDENSCVEWIVDDAPPEITKCAILRKFIRGSAPVEVKSYG